MSSRKSRDNYDPHTGMVEISLDASDDDLPRLVDDIESAGQDLSSAAVSIPSTYRPNQHNQTSLKSPVMNGMNFQHQGSPTNSIISNNGSTGNRKIIPIKEEYIPLIVQYLAPRDLYSCLTVSWVFFKTSIPELYSYVHLQQLAGPRLKRLISTLQNSVVRPDGSRSALTDYASFISCLDIRHIVFDDPSSPLQSWHHVRDLLRLCAPTLETLSLETGDESFMDLPPHYVYLHSHTSFPCLRRLQVTGRCPRFPEALILELLRASPMEGLQEIYFPRCLGNFSGSGWFLLAERGGSSLKKLVLTPAIGPNMLGWDESLFTQGLNSLVQCCPNMELLDLSGHALGMNDKTLASLLSMNPNIKECYLPCGLSDAHLITFLTAKPWPNLCRLGLTCRCIDGEIKEKAPNGMSCNKFADTTVVALLEHLLSAVKTPEFEVQLPVFLLGVRTGKRVDTISTLCGLPRVIKTGPESLLFRERIRLTIPTNRLAGFRH